MFDAYVHCESAVKVHFLYHASTFEDDHTFKTEAVVKSQRSPTMYKSRETYEAVHVSSAYLGRVELWRKAQVSRVPCQCLLFNCITK